MLALGIRYLTGHVAATEPDAYERVEWPPHPGRVFMALAAAHFLDGEDPAERDALLWLERLDEAPAIAAGDHYERSPVTQYVPVNDKAGPARALLQTVPLTRDRQSRNFARAFLEDDTVVLSWPSAEAPPPLRTALERLCARVSRIGHSSSLVQMWVVPQANVPDPAWVPSAEGAAIQLRLVRPGTLDYLREVYNGEAIEAFADLSADAEDAAEPKGRRAARKRLRAEYGDIVPPRSYPRLSAYGGYSPAKREMEPEVGGTVFDPHFPVLTLEREDGPRRNLDLPCVLAIVERWREAILSHSNGLPETARELLSGHDGAGQPLGRPHLAFLPLAFAGDPHADGRLLGMGILLPKDVPAEARREILRAVGSVRQLMLGRLGRWNVHTRQVPVPARNLRPATWTALPAGATRWSTVTPVVFDRHPKAKSRREYEAEAAETIALACTRIGLPRPREVIATPVSAHAGVPPASAFQRLRRKDGSQQRHTHAILMFDQPVCGPVIIGAGRYRGYGVGRPVVAGV